LGSGVFGFSGQGEKRKGAMGFLPSRKAGAGSRRMGGGGEEHKSPLLGKRKKGGFRVLFFGRTTAFGGRGKGNNYQTPMLLQEKRKEGTSNIFTFSKKKHRRNRLRREMRKRSRYHRSPNEKRREGVPVKLGLGGKGDPYNSAIIHKRKREGEGRFYFTYF